MKVPTRRLKSAARGVVGGGGSAGGLDRGGHVLATRESCAGRGDARGRKRTADGRSVQGPARGPPARGGRQDRAAAWAGARARGLRVTGGTEARRRLGNR